MTGFGTTRRETTHIVDSNHPEYNPEASIDASTIPYQMGSNKYASQKGKFLHSRIKLSYRL
jgi:hypothetical protein